MTEMIESQFAYLLGSFLYGFAALFAYDLVRILRVFIPHNKIAVCLEDCLFWITCSVFVFQMIYERNDGVLRGFFAVAFTVGMFLYFKVIGDHILNFVRKIEKGLKKAFSRIIMRIKKLLHR